MERMVIEAQVWRAGWEPAPRATPEPARPLRLVTWNAYFGGHMFDERVVGLLADLGRRQPDVIALQEVTPELLVAVRECPWVRRDYQLAPADPALLGGYGVALLSRAPIRKVSLHPLPSEMGRELLVAELACGLVVATVHLESTSAGGPLRRAQLAIVREVLAAHPAVALVGDMNIAPSDAEQADLAALALVDAWPAVHADDPGFTVDTARNPMRAMLKSTPTRKRIDRVLVRAWRPTAIELTGTAPIDADDTHVSDHFGLAVALAPP